MDAEQFWSRADRSGEGCWPWLGAISGNGYGTLKVAQVQYVAHRVAFELHHGRPVAPGRIVMHTCDNPPCVRPDHLVEGTHADNAHDRDTKGRGAKGDHVPPERRARGERVGSARLDAERVLAIRESPDSLGRLARRYGVSKQSISKIKRGATWSHV